MAKSDVMEIVFRYLVPKDDAIDASADLLRITDVEDYAERHYTKTFNLPQPMDLVRQLREAAQLVLATQMPDKKENWKGMFGFLLRQQALRAQQPIERMCWFCTDRRYIVTEHDAKGLVGRLTFLRDVKREVAQTIDNYFTNYKARSGLLVHPYGIDFSTPAAFKRYYLGVETMFFGLTGNNTVAIHPDERTIQSLSDQPVPPRPRARPKRLRFEEPV